MGRAIAGSKVALGAQNIYYKPEGAFTGEIAAAMLCDLGCRYVILGHSERRHILHETDEEINKSPRRPGRRIDPHRLRGRACSPSARPAGPREVIRRQFAGSLAGLSDEQMRKIVIAYEPVWAIGTGKVATPGPGRRSPSRPSQDHAANDIMRRLPRPSASNMGGASSRTTRPNCCGQPDIDGALVGGASLKADQFMGIVAGVN